MHEQFLSNTYLVAEGDAGAAFFVDAGGPVEPLLATAERLRLEPSHVLLTHRHFDHVSEVGALCERWPDIEVLIHPAELNAHGRLDGIGEQVRLGTIDAGDSLRFGALEVRPLHTPGHTAGMLSFLAFERERQPHAPSASSGPAGFGGGEAVVFTGDTLFKGSVGGVRAPGHTTCTDLKDSIMGTLMELPGATVVYPGHTDSTTVASEWEANPFIRIWRGLDPEGEADCLALDEPARLILLAEDYDGGKKAWVRWPDGSDDIVPGSRVRLTE